MAHSRHIDIFHKLRMCACAPRPFRPARSAARTSSLAETAKGFHTSDVCVRQKPYRGFRLFTCRASQMSKPPPKPAKPGKSRRFAAEMFEQSCAEAPREDSAHLVGGVSLMGRAVRRKCSFVSFLLHSQRGGLLLILPMNVTLNTRRCREDQHGGSTASRDDR